MHLSGLRGERFVFVHQPFCLLTARPSRFQRRLAACYQALHVEKRGCRTKPLSPRLCKVQLRPLTATSTRASQGDQGTDRVCSSLTHNSWREITMSPSLAALLPAHHMRFAIWSSAWKPSNTNTSTTFSPMLSSSKECSKLPGFSRTELLWCYLLVQFREVEQQS